MRFASFWFEQFGYFCVAVRVEFKSKPLLQLGASVFHAFYLHVFLPAIRFGFIYPLMTFKWQLFPARRQKKKKKKHYQMKSIKGENLLVDLSRSKRPAFSRTKRLIEYGHGTRVSQRRVN